MKFFLALLLVCMGCSSAVKNKMASTKNLEFSFNHASKNASRAPSGEADPAAVVCSFQVKRLIKSRLANSGCVNKEYFVERSDYSEVSKSKWGEHLSRSNFWPLRSHLDKFVGDFGDQPRYMQIWGYGDTYGVAWDNAMAICADTFPEGRCNRAVYKCEISQLQGFIQNSSPKAYCSCVKVESGICSLTGVYIEEQSQKDMRKSMSMAREACQQKEPGSFPICDYHYLGPK